MKQKEKRVYKFLVKYITKNHYAPSYREIQKACFIGSTASVYDYLRTLYIEGYIMLSNRKARSIVLLNRLDNEGK